MKLAILDRDGILNKLLYDPVTNIPDSPMTIEEIEVFPWVASCLKELNNLGYSIALATNQPAASKQKTTKENIYKIHNYILDVAKENGAVIGSSHICFHKSEDKCKCRKPLVGMLEQAWVNIFDKSKSWMIGDLHTDVMAGNTFGLNTALINSSDPKSMKILEEQNIVPTFIGKDLRDFVDMLKDKND